MLPIFPVTNAWITSSMNLATGNGGTCYGDSGGPHVIHINGVETHTVAAITVTGIADAGLPTRITAPIPYQPAASCPIM